MHTRDDLNVRQHEQTSLGFPRAVRSSSRSCLAAHHASSDRVNCVQEKHFRRFEVQRSLADVKAVITHACEYVECLRVNPCLSERLN